MKLTFSETVQLNELSFKDLGKSELYQKVLASPKFQSWFGPSKVRDEDGNPLICFHGTDVEFNTFHALSHFGTKGAADTRIEIATDHYLRNSRVIPVFLRIVKPAKIYDVRADHDEVWAYLLPMVQYRHVTMDQMSAFLDSVGMDVEKKDLVIGELIDYADRHKDYNSYTTFINRMESFGTDLNMYYNKRFRTAFLTFLRNVGIDGFVYENEVEDKGNMSWVITSPGQVLPVFHVYRFAKEEAT